MNLEAPFMLMKESQPHDMTAATDNLAVVHHSAAGERVGSDNLASCIAARDWLKSSSSQRGTPERLLP